MQLQLQIQLHRYTDTDTPLVVVVEIDTTAVADKYLLWSLRHLWKLLSVFILPAIYFFLPIFHCNRNTRSRRRQWRRRRAIESQPLNKFGIYCGRYPQIKSMLKHFNFNFQICLFATCRGELRIQIHKIIFTATSQTGSTYIHIFHGQCSLNVWQPQEFEEHVLV